jgi:hypothetical protein
MLPPNYEKRRDPANPAPVCGPGGADPGAPAAAVRGGAGLAPGTPRRVVMPFAAEPGWHLARRGGW